jgi:hypothetical protein
VAIVRHPFRTTFLRMHNFGFSAFLSQGSDKAGLPLHWFVSSMVSFDDVLVAYPSASMVMTLMASFTLSQNANSPCIASATSTLVSAAQVPMSKRPILT